MLTASPFMTGLQISQNQLRVVEVRETPTSIVVTRFGSHALADGLMINGHIVDPAGVGAAIRTLFESHGIRSQSVVVGVPSGQINSHISQVPQVSPRDLMLLAQGEAEHFRLITPGSDRFDYARLALTSGESRPAGDTPTFVSLLIMAMEDSIFRSYERAIQESGLRLAGLEPIPMACLRSVSPQMLVADRVTALLTVTDYSAALSVVRNGTMTFFRSLEAASLRITDQLEIPELLIQEARRSLEFYSREIDTGTAISVVYVIPDVARAEGLTEDLATELRLPVYLPQPFQQVDPGPPIDQGFLDEVGAKFAAPLGLALRGVSEERLAARIRQADGSPSLEAVRAIPKIDLSQRRFPRRELHLSLRLMASSLAATFLIAFAMYWAAVPIKTRLEEVQKEMTRAESEVERLSGQLQTRESIVSQVASAIENARQKTTPYPQLLRGVASVFPVQAWITDVQSESDGAVRLRGKASDAAHVSAALWRLYELGTTPRLDSMRSTRTGKTGPRVYEFEIIVQAPGVLTEGGAAR